MSARAKSPEDQPGAELPGWFAEVLAGGPEIADEDFVGTDLRELSLQRLHFSRCRFDEASLDGLSTEACSFTDCSFDRAELTGSTHLRTAFVACSFNRARFTGATLTECKLTGSVFADTPLRSVTVAGGGDWSAVSLGGADLRELDFSDVKLVGANVTGAKLDRCQFAGANLSGLRWGQASLRDADLRGAVIEGLDPRVVDLTGARVEVEQALAFAQYLGLRIG
jgi:fluoroquinolone resistance protein